MGGITLMLFVLALLGATLCSTNRWLHHIYVDNQTGVDNHSCWEGGYSTPCLSLNLALTGAQYYNHSTTIHLQPGQHQLYNGNRTQLRNMSKLAIVGNGSEGEVVINCEALAGLAFFWSEDIAINTVTLFGCGALQNSTSTSSGTSSMGFLQIRVALFFNGCNTINLTKLHVIESPGTGIVMYNPLGVVNIDKSEFLCNGLSKGMYGGGGLVLDANEAISELACTITSSNFYHNTASSGQFIYLSLIPSHDGHFGLGKGGGISVVFRGAVNNVVQLENVSLNSNTAHFGGGLFLEFLGNATNNKVHMDNCWLRENAALVDNDNPFSLSDLTKGGGVSISLMAGASKSNAVVISNTNFFSNEAHTGGGIAVNVLYNSYKYIGTGNELFIDNCKFTHNTALQGASAYFSQKNNCGQTVLSTTVSSSSFNGGYCVGLDGYRVYSLLPCYGNVLLESFQMILEGTVMFNNNQLSALSLQSSSIELLPLTQLEFKDNNALNGAAIYVVDCSSIIVNHNVALIFHSNSASNLGGAIYAESCHSSGLTGVESCFFRHANSTLHPKYWEIAVNFIDNKICGKYADTGNSIYVDSIGFCFWPDPLFGIHDHTHQIFCWIGWNYVDMYDCRYQLASGPAYVNNTGPTSYTVYPGECLSLKNYLVYDSWDNDITGQVSFQVDIVSGPGIVNIHAYPCDYGQFQVLPDHGVNKSMLLLVHPPQFTGVLVNVSFKLCENGSTYDYDRGACKYNVPECNNTSPPLVCKGPSSFCPTSNCYDDAKTCDIYTSNSFETCYSCADSRFGVAFNFPYFVCTKFEWYGIILVLLDLVLVLLMMIVLSVLHINITSGSMNGFILYSQLVSLDLPGLGSTAWVTSTLNNTYFMNTKQFASVPLTVYSIWNLNFLTLVPTPFGILNTSAAGVILLQYIKATCPLLFILVTYVWIRWYNNGYRFVVYTTRPVHQLLARFWQKFKIQPSLIDTYAGLMLLSYMQFLAVSVKTIYIFYLEHFFHSPFIVFNSVLVPLVTVSLLVFVFPLMTILLFYHLKIFQRCLICCKLDRPGLHALADAYQGCFKNSATDGSERRYFAGLYLFFRFLYLVAVAIVIIIVNNLTVTHPDNLPFTIYYLTILPIEGCIGFVTSGIVVILRPYKRTSHNVIDFLVLFCLTLIPPLSFLDKRFLNPPPYPGSNLLLFRNLIFLPFLILLFLLIYRLIKWCCTNMTCPCKCKTVHKPPPDGASLSEHTPLAVPPTTTEVALDDNYVQDDLYADRILNPGGYK